MRRFIFLFVMSCLPCFAVNHFVCPGASGTNTGTDWTNAYTGIGSNAGNISPASMVRGDTYYIANGQITPAASQLTFSSADSGTSVITIQKAIDGANGTNTGWTNGGTGACNQTQAVFGPLLFTTDYWVFTGVTRSTATGNPWVDWRNHSSYGFYINNNNGSNAPVINNTGAITGGVPGSNAPVHDLTLKYFEINGSHNGGSGCNLGGSAVDFDDGIHISGGQTSNIQIDHYYIHDVGVAATILVDGLGTGVGAGTTIELGWNQNTCVTNAQHSEMHNFRAWNGSSANGLIDRYNYLENGDGTAYIATPCGCSEIHPGNWAIYGNVFFYNASEAYANQAGDGDGWLSLFNFANWTGYLYVFNNTISGIDQTSGGGTPTCHHDWGGFTPTSMGNVAFYNNLIYNCKENINPPACPATGSNCTTYVDDYNSYFGMTETNDTGAHVQGCSGGCTSTNPFVSVGQSANQDNFLLAGGSDPTSAWFNTHSLFAGNDNDLLGVARTSSRGTFQFGSAASSSGSQWTTGIKLTTGVVIQ